MADRAVAIDGGPGVAAYTVQAADAGEGLTGVARRLYGDAERWIEIFEANRAVIGNNPAVIRCGQQLVIPRMGGARTPAGAARVYAVQPLDVVEGLAGVARRLYGDAGRWAELYAVNRGVVGESPGLLQAGQRLIVLP